MADDLTNRLYRLVGERVRLRRQACELTQDELADRIGRSRTSVTNLERGRQKIPLHQLLRISLALNIEPHDLVPTRQELDEQPGTVDVKVGDQQYQLPRAAADVLEGILSETKDARTPPSES